ncbi:MAG: potassium-transporting ATPase subunit KdpC [Verrucomicrobiae bacterium]|nr:potassium-transporting ATPase subunit KdpC [Verrucomicrobiae bacterium]
MKTSLESLRMLLMMTLLTGLLYPALVTLLGQGLFPGPSRGSLIVRDGMVIGSRLLAQKFSRPGYFQPRPSAVDYGTVPSGASQLGPASSTLQDRVAERRQNWQQSNPGSTDIPPDMRSASGSGLDPHLTPAAARQQVLRIARIRGLEPSRIEALINTRIEGPDVGVFGQERVNVLMLNLELDTLK